ncbi:hypothetical protein ACET3X_000280 [Alternaria dauci]|uniref:Insecticidal crystal toxin domain-containing protein n=1 Tax=Alternaria dauci TaxID=48095 RepID=A0ABR3UTY8_9PLEO
MQSIQDKVNKLTKLPSPSQRAPDLASGRIRLYQDFNWNSNNTEIDIHDNYRQKERFQVDRNLFDKASWIAFNLPVGTVLTFMDHLPSVPASGKYADLSDAGRTMDLIGTGQIEGVDLDQLQMNDKISQFFWRTVDMNQGAIELFDDQDFKNNRVTIYVSLSFPRGLLFVSDNEGRGDRFSRIMGGGETREVRKLQDSGFNDRITAFRWSNINPAYEQIQAVVIADTDQKIDQSIQETIWVENRDEKEALTAIEFSKEYKTEITTTVKDTYATGMTAEYSVSGKAGIGIVEATVGWKVAVKFDYARETTKSTSVTNTLTLGVDQSVMVPARSKRLVYVTVHTSKVESKTYTTKAERWYRERLTGSYKSNKGGEELWKRDETVQITVTGGLQGKTKIT